MAIFVISHSSNPDLSKNPMLVICIFCTVMHNSYSYLIRNEHLYYFQIQSNIHQFVQNNEHKKTKKCFVLNWIKFELDLHDATHYKIL
jgi:hypothetical protein